MSDKQTAPTMELAHTAMSKASDLLGEAQGALGTMSTDLAPTIASQAEAIEHLQMTLSLLKAEGGAPTLAEARRYLEAPAEAFDVVFLDPPFADETLPTICALLESRGWLSPSALIYIERPAREAGEREGSPTLPDGWVLHRTGHAGEVGYHLARRQAAPLARGDTR